MSTRSKTDLVSNKKGTAARDESKKFVPGYRIEVLDVDGIWYPARIEQIDWTGREVLVHFDKWSSTFDEWVSMDSNRIKSVEQPEPKKRKEFSRGDEVMAMWSQYHKYRAVVQRVLPDGKYEVLFDDGYVKCVPSNRLWKRDFSDNPGPSNEGGVDIGSKQDRRDRMRKFSVNVVELFKTNKRSSAKRQTDSPGRTMAAAQSSKQPTVKSEAASTVRSSLQATSNVPGLSTEGTAELLPNKEIEVEYKDGRKEIWNKQLTRRSEGKTAGRLDIVISSPQGRKFRSRNEILRYCEEHKIHYNADAFDFSAKNRRRSHVSTSHTPPATAPAPPEPEVAVPQQPSEPPPSVPEPLAPKPTVPILLSTDDEDESKKYIGNLEIVVEDGQFICPIGDCRKHFRKENLLHMHMKHYHPDLSKYLDYTPSVTDLAYARTASSDLVAETSSGSPRSLSRRSLDPKRSPFRTKECRVTLDKDVKVEKLIKATEDVADTTVQATESSAADAIPEELAAQPVVPEESKVSTEAVAPTILIEEPPQPKSPKAQKRPHPVAVPEEENVTIAAPDPSPVSNVESHVEKLRKYEIINCLCQLKEEDGLMIQCDICLCWQHAHCLGISRQSNVPDSYVCSICNDPLKGRSSRRYRNHQAWIKEGVLPSLSYTKRNREDISNRQALLKRSFELSGQLSMLMRLLHSLRTKLSIAKHKDHPKLWMWANDTTTVKMEEPGAPKVPEPEKPINAEECKEHLLANIQRYHDVVESRIASLESQLDELESLEDDLDEKETCPRTKQTIVMLLKDLGTLDMVSKMS